MAPARGRIFPVFINLSLDDLSSNCYLTMMHDVPGSLRRFLTLVEARNAKVQRFINRLHLSAYSRFDHTAAPYRSAEDHSKLHKYSVTDYTFWLDLWRFLGIISPLTPTKVHSLSEVSQRIHMHYLVDPERGIHQGGPRRTFESCGEHVAAHR
jgi:hypothetical protein